MMKVCIYTAVCGPHPFEAKARPSEARCIAFSNKPVPDGWERRDLPEFSTLPYASRRNSRAPKILSHLFLPEFDYTIWIDASKYDLWNSVERIIDEDLSEHDIAVRRHWNPDIYDEASRAAAYSQGELLSEQAAWYRKSPFGKVDHSLAVCSVIARRHTPQIARFNMAWWEQICRWASRDQVSFPYTLWATETKCKMV